MDEQKDWIHVDFIISKSPYGMIDWKNHSHIHPNLHMLSLKDMNFLIDIEYNYYLDYFDKTNIEVVYPFYALYSDVKFLMLGSYLKSSYLYYRYVIYKKSNTFKYIKTEFIEI